MSLLRKFAVALMVMVGCGTSIPSFAAENTPIPADAPSTNQATAAQPIMIIRFNKADVYYKAPLKKIIGKALSMKPTVAFNVVSLIPETQDTQATPIAEHNGKKIAEAIAASGVDKERITLVLQQSSDIQFNEVHVLAH